MRVLKRQGYGRKSKMRSVKHFKHRTRRTKSPNTVSAPQRGGWRL
jgi:hypothetical protein